MIKGFIEVTVGDSNTSYLININWIECVVGSRIYLSFSLPNASNQDRILCNETYEEIKRKIKEAEQR